MADDGGPSRAKKIKLTSASPTIAEVDTDFRYLELQSNHEHRPIWVTPDRRIFLETFSPIYQQAYDFLIAVAEPVCRPELIHEYQLTPHSLYAATSIGINTETIINVLNRLSKVTLSNEVTAFIRNSTQNYGKVKLVLKQNKFYMESTYPAVLKHLLADPVVVRALASDVDPESLSFEILPDHLELVKQRCQPDGLNYPMIEEYDFRNDTVNPNINIKLRWEDIKMRPYQDTSLFKMFGNGRARSGIIVLPCGAGKSLVGVAAAARINKSCLCLCTSSVSVDQWKHQFHLWTTLQDHQVSKFTSESKELCGDLANVCVTTFSMIAFSGKRSEESEKIMRMIQQREWGLLLMDEVHVVPAQMFRKVISITRSHCKLGLTATLIREDERIGDLNFLIGPKLYEANWLDLTRAGHIANVQCAEVRCEMTKKFYTEYLKDENRQLRQLLYVMNPNKFMTCQRLVEYHEKVRGDKVIVFSDNTWALREYATRLGKPFIYGPTSHRERTLVLDAFKNNPAINTIFLSKIGDNSIDIPEANVLIQISSHAGSRRQEAQRLGRVLRAKKNSNQPSQEIGKDEFSAFFYTLVSSDTQEMYYSTKRQQFLVDQGYSFKVISSLSIDVGTQQAEITEDQQADLLARILSARLDEAGVEADDEQISAAERGRGKNKTI